MNRILVTGLESFSEIAKACIPIANSPKIPIVTIKAPIASDPLEKAVEQSLGKVRREHSTSPLTPWKLLTLKIFHPGNKKYEIKKYKADKGMVFTESGIQRILEDMAQILEKTFPQQEFRLVELGHGNFNFVNETET